MLRTAQEINFREQSLRASKNISPLWEIQAEWNSQNLVKLSPSMLAVVKWQSQCSWME